MGVHPLLCAVLIASLSFFGYRQGVVSERERYWPQPRPEPSVTLRSSGWHYHSIAPGFPEDKEREIIGLLNQGWVEHTRLNEGRSIIMKKYW